MKVLRDALWTAGTIVLGLALIALCVWASPGAFLFLAVITLCVLVLLGVHDLVGRARRVWDWNL